MEHLFKVEFLLALFATILPPDYETDTLDATVSDKVHVGWDTVCRCDYSCRCGRSCWERKLSCKPGKAVQRTQYRLSYIARLLSSTWQTWLGRCASKSCEI